MPVRLTLIACGNGAYTKWEIAKEASSMWETEENENITKKETEDRSAIWLLYECGSHFEGTGRTEIQINRGIYLLLVCKYAYSWTIQNFFPIIISMVSLSKCQLPSWNWAESHPTSEIQSRCTRKLTFSRKSHPGSEKYATFEVCPDDFIGNSSRSDSFPV